MSFNLAIPLETKLRMFKLQTPRREVRHECYVCGRTRPVPELNNSYNKGACNRCMIDEFGKGE